MTTPICPDCKVPLRNGECPKCWTRWPDLVKDTPSPEEETHLESSDEEEIPCPQCGKPLDSSGLVRCDCLNTNVAVCLCSRSGNRGRGWFSLGKPA